MVGGSVGRLVVGSGWRGLGKATLAIQNQIHKYILEHDVNRVRKVCIFGTSV